MDPRSCYSSSNLLIGKGRTEWREIGNNREEVSNILLNGNNYNIKDKLTNFDSNDMESRDVSESHQAHQKSTNSAQQAPLKQHPVQHYPVQHHPLQHYPVQHQPVQQHPVQHQPVQQNPVHRQPVQQQPILNRPHPRIASAENEPEIFLKQYFAQSRLHFIGSWRNRLPTMVNRLLKKKKNENQIQQTVIKNIRDGQTMKDKGGEGERVRERGVTLFTKENLIDSNAGSPYPSSIQNNFREVGEKGSSGRDLIFDVRGHLEDDEDEEDREDAEKDIIAFNSYLNNHNHSDLINDENAFNVDTGNNHTNQSNSTDYYDNNTDIRISPSSSISNYNKNQMATTGNNHLTRIVIHLDMDCFFVSAVLRSEAMKYLRDQPVAVAHSADTPYIVSSTPSNISNNIATSTTTISSHLYSPMHSSSTSSFTSSSSHSAAHSVSSPTKLKGIGEQSIISTSNSLSPSTTTSPPRPPTVSTSFSSSSEISSCNYPARISGISYSY